MSVAFVCATIGILGCSSRTKVGGFTDSNDRKYRVYVAVWGASGSAYNISSKKSIRIRIVGAGGREPLLLERHYSVSVSSLDWHATWDEQNSLSVVFFDYGPNVDSLVGEKMGKPKRRVHSVNYHFDPKTGIFTER